MCIENVMPIQLSVLLCAIFKAELTKKNVNAINISVSFLLGRSV